VSVELFFVRHVPHTVQDRVMAGRMPGIQLAEGASPRLAWLQARLARERIDRVVAGPLERVQETARAIAAPRGLSVETDPDLDEIDAGGWTGKTLAELDGDPDWTVWSRVRAQAKAPGGESMAEIQARMARATGRLIREGAGTGVVIVSHGDPIKLALTWRLGLGVDRMDSLRIDPGSVSILTITERGAELRLLNETPPPG
jgi:broad specificity phosphatase PhoE